MEWISVKDQLPIDVKSYEQFLVVTEWIDTMFEKGTRKIYVDVAYFNSYHKLFVTDQGYPIEDQDTKVTHWSRFPEPPKQ